MLNSGATSDQLWRTQDFTDRFEAEEYEAELLRRNFLISAVGSRWTWTTQH